MQGHWCALPLPLHHDSTRPCCSLGVATTHNLAPLPSPCHPHSDHTPMLSRAPCRGTGMPSPSPSPFPSTHDGTCPHCSLGVATMHSHNHLLAPLPSPCPPHSGDTPMLSHTPCRGTSMPHALPLPLHPPHSQRTTPPPCASPRAQADGMGSGGGRVPKAEAVCKGAARLSG